MNRVRIQGFRCLEDTEIFFGDVTTFVGPNGSGKSSILRVLDWFFNGSASSFSDEDVFSGFEREEQRRITVEVEFISLTVEDRAKLGKYAPESVDSVVIWRRWEGGVDKITGKAKAYPEFEEVRRGENATVRRERYNLLRSNRSELGLPTASSATAVEEAMLAWERANPDLLVEAEIPGTNFFGFAGQGVMSGLFDFVLVTADLRANEETLDSKSTIIGRILERAVDRKAADDEIAELVANLGVQQSEIQSRHFDEQLGALSIELTSAVGAFTGGREVQVQSEQLEVKLQTAHFRVSIKDHIAETKIDRQGHGFQRALLIASLRLLAERSASISGSGVFCLAIEEPELFQHPQQAKAFASVLRTLAEDPAQGMQVTYATHSPYFIEPKHFDQVRRVSRKFSGESTMPRVEVHGTSETEVAAKLAGFVDPVRVREQIDGVAVNRLQDSFFAQGVILVEGETDAGVLEGSATRESALFLRGIVVASVGGKGNLLLPWAILTLLGIPCYLVADGDKDCAALMRLSGKTESDIRATENNQKGANRALLRIFEYTEVDWPPSVSHTELAFFENNIESFLDANWPEWRLTVDGIVSASLGDAKKNASIYREAAEKAPGIVPPLILEIIEKSKLLADA